jgi:hypothetical protein
VIFHHQVYNILNLQYKPCQLLLTMCRDTANGLTLPLRSSHTSERPVGSRRPEGRADTIAAIAKLMAMKKLHFILTVWEID